MCDTSCAECLGWRDGKANAWHTMYWTPGLAPFGGRCVAHLCWMPGLALQEGLNVKCICSSCICSSCICSNGRKPTQMQGDVLSGTLAAFKSWASNNPGPSEEAARRLGLQPTLLAAWGACATVRQVRDGALPCPASSAAQMRSLSTTSQA